MAASELAAPGAPDLDLTRPATVRAVARRAGLRVSRRLGQHFLVDQDALESIVRALQPSGRDTVVEIGCGVGTLTGALAALAGSVIALDVDPACVRATQMTQRRRSNVHVVRADARQLDPAEFGINSAWLAAGNLPYRITGRLLGHLLELPSPPERAAFLVQREVAARLAATAGDWSLATLAVRSLATVERVRDVPPAAFVPPPAVHSAVILVCPGAALDRQERARLIHLARPVFQQRRKTIRHGLTHALEGDAAAASRALDDAAIEPGRRPGTLDLDEWQRLAGAVSRMTAAKGESA
ncbi:MAG: ribosomal RNA small subunit methyltransferase A [Candidatus Dormibacteraeota bacterium]|nr:ribosomal RNA small subunit methyltransferase A [Candidatus Dormibacteraeota bacterium]MBV9526344.1 ribosomal RNA small subunit methyltransferase A [Candidatus Dormibacteraeota bacterium]